jgi:hypothetical protein
MPTDTHTLSLSLTHTFIDFKLTGLRHPLIEGCTTATFDVNPCSTILSLFFFMFRAQLDFYSRLISMKKKKIHEAKDETNIIRTITSSRETD